VRYFHLRTPIERMKGRLVFLALCISTINTGLAQDTTALRAPTNVRSWDILIGGNIGHYTYLEAGFARRHDRVIGHHPFTRVFHAGAEVLIGPEVIIAPKAGAWIGGGAAGMCLGSNLLYYISSTTARPALRPEIGIGFERFKAAYGYNIMLNGDLERVNRHMFSLAILFSVNGNN
jgi:hypothetical protein